ncbi:MAG: SBBP repeat-containing protein [Planctomycetota bacterium]
MRRALCSSALLALVASTAASAPRSLRSTFAPNLGQARADCRFVSQRAGAAILLSPHAITLCRARGRPDDAIELQLANASSHVSLVGQCERAGRINYLRGSDSAQWLIGVPCYDEVHYTQVYPGIDLVVHAATDALEYDLIVAPGTSPDAIAIDCRGLRSLAIDDHGDLIMTTASGVLRQRRPLSYQIVRGERRVLPSRFRMLGAARFGFAVDGRDPGQLLIIDPLLEYSTFLGGSGEDRAGAVRVDAGGAAYVAGVTASLDFPFTGSAFPDPPGSGQDVFVVKLAPSGQDVVYATYFGGDDDDTGTDLAIDAAGNAVVVGTTRSADFPTTPGAYSRSHHGDGDVFACRLDATGVATYSTLLGGSGDDYALGVDLDPSGNAWLTGGVRSSDFPVTSNAFDKTRNGDYDVFVAELSATGQSLLYSTFVGGGSFDDGFDLAFHGSDQVYVTGRTRSSDFPTTSGAFDRSYSSSLDTFVFRLDVGDRNLVYSTFVSAPVRDEGHAIAVDGQGNAFVTGEARSEDFPVTDDAYDRSFNQGYDGFVFKLNPAGSALIYSTFIGGIINDVAWDLAIDDDGNAYVTGVTASAIFEHHRRLLHHVQWLERRIRLQARPDRLEAALCDVPRQERSGRGRRHRARPAAHRLRHRLHLLEVLPHHAARLRRVLERRLRCVRHQARTAIIVRRHQHELWCGLAWHERHPRAAVRGARAVPHHRPHHRQLVRSRHAGGAGRRPRAGGHPDRVRRHLAAHPEPRAAAAAAGRGDHAAGRSELRSRAVRPRRVHAGHGARPRREPRHLVQRRARAPAGQRVIVRVSAGKRSCR